MLIDLLLRVLPPVVTFVLGVATGVGAKRLLRKLRGKSDVQIYIETDPEIIYANAPDWITFPQFVPCSADDLPAAPAGKALAMTAWAAELGGLPAHRQELQVTVTAWEDRDVVVSTFRISAEAAALPEGVVAVRPVGGASLESRRLEVKLSTWAPEVTAVEPGGLRTDNIAAQLKAGESLRFHLSIVADGEEDVDLYEWRGHLDLIVGSRRVTKEITDRKGRPFRLSNRGRRTELWWTSSGWEPPLS